MFPWLTWKFSLLLPLALLLGLGTWVWQSSRPAESVDLTINSADGGAPIAGAVVWLGETELVATVDGRVSIDVPKDASLLRVEAPGYHTVTGQVSTLSASTQTVILRPNTLAGRITDQATGESIANASLTVVDRTGSTIQSVSTGEDGSYLLADLPEVGTIEIDAGIHGKHSVPLGSTATLDLTFERQSASGIVMDAEGVPLQGAVVQFGDASAITSADGSYVIDGVRDGDELVIRASGYEGLTAVVNQGVVTDVRLPAQMIKAVYANANLLTTEGGLDLLIEIANTTEVNAIVIDVKEGVIFYDSEVPFFNEVGTVRPIYDLEAILAKLAENDIYAIARMVVFQDPLVAEARNDLAVHDINGGLWVNEMGVGWVSAFHEELWQANIDLAVELVERGFEEVQYDYVRFPSDGDLSTADFGREYTAEAREAAITEFMRRSHEAVNAAGGYLAADLFGFVTIMDDEQYIGQRFSALAPHLDFVNMMIYPSHFEEGNIVSAPGHPNDFPYETIFESLERAELIVPNARLKFRPWLQDFSYGYNGLRDYTAADVRAQIDAAEDFGASGWMLWGSPFHVTVEALEPEPEI